VISFSSYPDETTALATLVLPDHTPLESWGEYSPRSGVNGLMQPAVAPVFDTRATGDVLLASAARAGHNLGAAEFREYLRKEHGGDDAAWAALLQLGGAFSEPAPTPARAAAPLSAPSGPAPVPVAPADGRLVLHIYPSLHFYDGRTANRPWAQEIPDPMAKAVWGSWAEIHPDAAKRFGVQDGDVMALETAAGRIEAPALLTDRVVSGVVAIQRGQGHTNLGRFADGIGVNPLALLPAVVEPASGALVVSGGDVAVRKLAVRRPPVVLQTSMKQVGAAIARAVTVAQLAWTRRKGGLNGEGGEEEGPLRGRKNPSLYANAQHPKHHWGMAIDLDTCLGCNACVASCYAENNVPVVGREGCSRGREMSWLRIENYTEEGASGLLRIQAKKPADTGPRTNLTRFFPMLCQQCDNAPCEYVCPVDATVHSSEGLNMQVYNRCVGTRYCSNNCPYKVRRFNFFPPAFEPPLDQQLNPEVTVRSKGVMEKCTFCIQRIEAGKVQAKAEGRPVRDGEIRTACQNACPTDAIVFGDLKDENSRAAQLAKGARGYGALEELNTLPNVTYLARVRAE
jgi:molybdopterin-containing oxidoreductase family iron-sulfur binding subunit